MNKKITLVFTLLLCLFYIEGNAQTQFWSDTFEDSGAPSIGTRNPSIAEFSCGGSPATAYFKRSQASDLSIQNTPFVYSAFEGSKFWAAEDIDKGPTCTNSSITANQQVTWSGINISGKTGLSFKGLFAAANLGGWQGINWGVAQDFLAVEYRIDGGAWTKAIAFYSKEPASSPGSQNTLDLDTDGDMIGDGASLNYTFTEYSVNITGTGTTLDLRFNCFANASVSQELAIDNFRLFEAPACTAPTIVSNPPNRTICPSNNTTFSISATGATSYQWQVNTGSGFTDIANAGVYTNATTNTLTVTGATAGMSGYLYRCKAIDSSCTTNSNSATLTVSNPSLTAASQTNVSCFGGSNGSATVNAASGGISPYGYSWSPSGGTGTTASGLTPTTYTCTVTDANSCTATQSFTITQPTALSATTSQMNVACNGGSNGTATVNASGGTPGYTYSWSPSGGTGATASGLAAGTYVCTITDANSCTTTRSFTITQPTAITATTSQTNVACNGGSNGTATVIASGGSPGYTYSWSPSGGTGATASGLSANTYVCTITDANSCTTTKSFTITQPTAIALSPSSQTNIACFGGSSGAAAVNSATGGAGGYTYDWTPGTPTGDGTNSVSGLSAGTWTCTVTDANGCTATQGFTVTQPNAIVLTPASQTNIACFGGATGAASVNTATGGAGGYTYNWTPGNPTGDGTTSVSGLTAGTWTCTVTDANGCIKTQSFTVTQPGAIALTAASQTNVSCNSGSNGSATVNATGGTPAYNYSWAPTGGSAASATGLTAGTYTVTVTDDNGCTATKSFTITEPSTLIASAAAQTNVSCNSGTNGSATVNPTGGTPGYSYSWSPAGGTAATASGLSQGTYTVTVTDSKGCTATQSFTITQPTAIALTPASQTNIACFGGSTGAATVTTATGGAGGYTYNWTPGNPTGDGTTSVSGLSAGTWTCTVTDANGCTKTQSFTVTQPNAIVLTPVSQTNIACFGGATGAASVNTATGGAGGYTYNWTPGNPTGDGTRSVSGLTAGTWTCTVTDANGCIKTQSFTVTQPGAIALTAASQTNVSCNSGSNGSATVNATGGTPGYNYSWSPNGGSAASASGLTAGTYTVTVTDDNGCTATKAFTITEPNTLTASAGAQTNVSCNSGTNGSATVNPTGGTPGYSYSWSPAGGTAATASGLSQGTYTVTITDSKGCTATQSFTITQPTAIALTPASQTNIACFSGSTGAATVNTATGGAGGYTYNWTPGNPTGDGTTSVSGLSAGTWTCTVTDANGCTKTQSFTVTQPNAIVLMPASQTNIACFGGSTGAASVNTATGGAGGYTYNWTPGNPTGDGTTSVSGLTAGTWTCTVTDSNSCTTSQSFTVTEPTQLSFTTTNLPVYDFNVAYSESIMVTGGSGTKTYTVTSGSLPSGFNLLSDGTITGTSNQIADSNFTITATDENDCSNSQAFILKLSQIPITVTATSSQTKVYGESDPVLSYTATPSLLPGDNFSGSLDRVTGENTGNYAISQGSLSAGSKYLITYVGTDFSITAKPITVTADASQTKVYGTVDPVFSYSVSPILIGNDTFTGALIRDAGNDVGAYAIQQGDLSAGSNYMITYVSTNFVITAMPITVMADASQTKVYGTVDPIFTYSVSPSLVNGDTFTGALTRLSGNNVGTYAIEQGDLNAATNYAITYVSKDFKITAKPITVTADASQAKVYGTMDPVFSYSVLPILESGDSFTGALTRVAGNDVGKYTIGQGNLSAGTNYAINYVGKDFTITPKTITVTANTSQTKVYGTADPIFTYSVSPSLITGDSFTGVLNRVAGSNVGMYAITQGTLSTGSNYSLSYISNDFSITKADQIITWSQSLALGCDGANTLALTATSSSGLLIDYVSSNSNVATVTNGSLIFQNYGSAAITASQLGDSNYNPALVVVLPVVKSVPNLIRKQFENIIFFDNSSNNYKAFTWYKNGILVSGQTSQYFKENSVLNGTYYAVATKLDGRLITTCPLILSPTAEEEYIKLVPNPTKTNSNYQLVTNVSLPRLQNAHIQVYSIGGLLMDDKIATEKMVTLKAPGVEGIYIVRMTLSNGKYFTKNLLVKN